MKVFISWSGDRSKAVAEELREWLPTVVQTLEPFVSTQDIPVGGRGLNVLASELQECSFGILCLTQENKQGPWINFEAGALSKVIDTSRVVPLLLDLKISDVTGPLAQFQAVLAGDKEDVFSLVQSLAVLSSPPVTGERLRRLFDAFWPELENRITDLSSADIGKPRQENRTEREILEEVLVLSRRTEKELTRVANIRTGESVIRSRGHTSTEQPPWWTFVGKAAGNNLYSDLHRIGVRIASFFVDDLGLHVVIEDLGDLDLKELQLHAQSTAEAYRIPISIRGEPFGEESFSPSSASAH